MPLHDCFASADATTLAVDSSVNSVELALHGFLRAHEFDHYTLSYQERRAISRYDNFDYPLIAGFIGCVRLQFARAKRGGNSDDVPSRHFARIDLRSDLRLLPDIHIRYRALNDLGANDVG